MTELIEKARSEYKAENAFWAASLINALEPSHLSQALTWATKSVVEIARQSTTIDGEELIRSIANVEPRADAISPDKLFECAETIWYRNPDVLYQSASRLFAARASLMENDDYGYTTHLVKAMMFLGESSVCKKTECELVFDLFRQQLDSLRQLDRTG